MPQIFSIRFGRSMLCSVLLMVLSACGGGGGDGPSTSISLSTNSMSFNVGTNEAEASQRVQVQFDGSGVVVGYAPNVIPLSWVTAVQAGPATDSTVPFDIRVTPYGMAPGTYSTSLRFLTGIVPPGGNLNDAHSISHRDLAITITIARFDTSPAFAWVDLIAGSPAPKTGIFSLNTPVQTPWTATSDSDWLTVTTPTGTGPQAIGYSASAASLSNGIHDGRITVTDNMGRRAFLRVTASVSAPLILLTPYQATLQLPASGGTPASGSFAVEAEPYVSWVAATTSPWITLATSSGNGSGTVNYSVSAVGLSPGQYFGNIAITDKGGKSTTHLVNLQVQEVQLTLAPESLHFNISNDFSAAARTRFLTVSDELGGSASAPLIPWKIAHNDSSWFSVSPSSGTSSPGTQISVVVPADALAELSIGRYEGTFTVQYEPAGGGTQTLTVPVVLNLNSAITELTIPMNSELVPIAGGANVRLNTLATYAHGRIEDETYSAIWTSSNTAVASFDPSQPGVVRTHTAGETVITATVPGSSIQASVTLKVKAPTALVYVIDSRDPPSIHQFVSRENGRLQPMAVATVPIAASPLHLTFTPDGKFAYLVHGQDFSPGQYGVSQFRVNVSGSLSALEPNHVMIGSYYPQAAVVEQQGRKLYVATTNPARVASLDIGVDGKLTLDAKPPVDIAATSSTYGITIHPTLPYLYLADFNGAMIRSLQIKGDASLSLQADAPATGQYPQYIEMHPSGQYAYVTNSISYNSRGAVSQYSVQPDGQFLPMQTPMLLEGKWGRNLALTPSGNAAFLGFTTPDPYGYSGETSIATFAIEESGALTHKYNYAVSSLGEIAVDPTGKYLYVTTGFDSILLYRIDNGGLLVKQDYQVNVKTPRAIVVRTPGTSSGN